MVKEEIVEGLKVAMSKGDSLNKAMMSFFNSGYLKSDIEEAARQLQAPQVNHDLPISASSSKLYSPQPVADSRESEEDISEGASQVAKPQSSNPTPLVQAAQKFPPIQQIPQTTQKVSSYPGKPKGVSGRLVFVLSIILVILVGLLIGIFLFRDKITTFFSGIMG